MKRLCLIILLITFIICAGCSSQTAEIAKVTQQNPVNVHNSIAASNSSSKQSSKQSISNQSKTKKTEELSPVPSTAAAKKAAASTENSNTGPARQQSRVTLWVTRDYAGQGLFNQEVPLRSGASVMEVLQKNLPVETQYGGGFVNSINGLASGYTGADKKTRDWFYYVNGIITSVGALDYKPAPGEIIWWDYHDWGASAFTPALIGAFPQPFRSGYRGINPGTLILAAMGHEQQGEKLAAYLKSLGVKQVEVKPYSASLLLEDKKITIVLGLWKQLKDDKYWLGLQKQRQKTGLFVELNPEYFAALDDQGAKVQQYKQNIGAIVATGSGMGDNTPVWLVTGLDTAGLEGALDTLIKNPQAIKQHFGALVEGDKIISVPVAR